MTNYLRKNCCSATSSFTTVVLLSYVLKEWLFFIFDWKKDYCWKFKSLKAFEYNVFPSACWVFCTLSKPRDPESVKSVTSQPFEAHSLCEYLQWQVQCSQRHLPQACLCFCCSNIFSLMKQNVQWLTCGGRVGIL